MLNSMAGMPVILSRETFELIDKAVFAWKKTRGRFDPTVLAALVALGYDRSFETIDAEGPTGLHTPAPGCAGIELDRTNLAVTLPRGVTIDPGGIGKGLAADTVVRELLAAGASGAMVNLGGDVRVAGRSSNDDGWSVLVEDPFTRGEALTTIHLNDGAVATSSRLERSWQRDGVPYHHIIDPGSGLPCAGDVAAVTVVAGTAWWAEVMAKTVFGVGTDQAWRVLDNAQAVVVDVDGRHHHSPGFEELAA